MPKGLECNFVETKRLGIWKLFAPIPCGKLLVMWSRRTQNVIHNECQSFTSNMKASQLFNLLSITGLT